MLRMFGSATGPGPNLDPVQVVQSRHGIVVLVLSGELDIACTPRLQVAINEVLRAHPPALVIDLCRVSFADSTVLALLLNVQRRATRQGTPLRMACDVTTTLELFTLTRLDREFEIHPTRRAAIRACRPQA